MAVEDSGIRHLKFFELRQLLRPGDVLVINETRVISARLLGRRIPTGGRAELLLLHPAGSMRYEPDAARWIALVRPARRLHIDDRIGFGELGEAIVREEHEEGIREVELRLTLPFEAFLQLAGRMPLPPYIHNDSAEAQRRYQTVFAKTPGSVAAPTASLHFTASLLDEIADNGVEIVRISLNVGLGTFRPMATDNVESHVMHSEFYAIPALAAHAIELARREQRRIVAVGTTVVRALEGNMRTYGTIRPGEHTTDLFIAPGFCFQVVDALITNFHLPRSTLLMLVSAFGGVKRVRTAYEQAIAAGYRFYSFGDAMFVTPERS